MTEHLQGELLEAKVHRLRQRMSLGAPTVHKYLSLVLLVHKMVRSGAVSFSGGFFLQVSRFLHAWKDGRAPI